MAAVSPVSVAVLSVRPTLEAKETIAFCSSYNLRFGVKMFVVVSHQLAAAADVAAAFT